MRASATGAEPQRAELCLNDQERGTTVLFLAMMR